MSNFANSIEQAASAMQKFLSNSSHWFESYFQAYKIGFFAILAFGLVLLACCFNVFLAVALLNMFSDVGYSEDLLSVAAIFICPFTMGCFLKPLSKMLNSLLAEQ